MKKQILLFAIFSINYLTAICGNVEIQRSEDPTDIVNYTLDTIETYMAGPGIRYLYCTVDNGSTLRNCYIYEVDLKNQYNAVEESHHPNLGTTELMTAAHKRLDSAGHRSIGSVNCNFWFVNDNEGLLGVGATGQVRNGKIGASVTTWNKPRTSDPIKSKQEVGYCMIDRQKRAFVDEYSWDAKLYIGSQSYEIREANRNRNNPKTNEIVLFNNDLGTKATRETDQIEVLLKMNDEWAINKDLKAVVSSINHTGGTVIEEGYAVLQGRGTGATVLEQLKEGDEVSLNIGIYASLSEERPDMMQLLAGNCLVMINKELTIRNWNEDYNNQNYPRTGFATNATHDTLWAMVMEKPGMYTHEMCCIFRHFGATDACGADGGGSAQFNLFGEILNPTTEPTARAVSNCMFLFSTAPDDPTPHSLYSATTEINLPRYAMIKPKYHVYNQYGVMIERDFTDVDYTCSPEVGYITEDGYFVCLANGTLTASLGEAKMDIKVNVVEGTTSFRLDSVWIDQRHNYNIEVESSTNDNDKYLILSSVLDWESSNLTAFTIDNNGTLWAYDNGSGYVYGTIDDKTDSIYVTTELAPETSLLLTDFSNTDIIPEPYCTSTSSKMTYTCSSEGALVQLNYKKSRAPSIEFENENRLWGLPTSADIHIDNKNMPITSIEMYVYPRIGKEAYFVANNISMGEQTIHIDFEELLGTDINIYPIRISYLMFMLDGTASDGSYEMLLKDITLNYGGSLNTGISTNKQEDISNCKKIFHNGQLYIIRNNTIYNILGNEIK